MVFLDCRYYIFHKDAICLIGGKINPSIIKSKWLLFIITPSILVGSIAINFLVTQYIGSQGRFSLWGCGTAIYWSFFVINCIKLTSNSRTIYIQFPHIAGSGYAGRCLGFLPMMPYCSHAQGHGMCMACIWHVYGMCMACVWHLPAWSDSKAMQKYE